ncbi:SWIM zinc finger family protein [Streptomyces sp. NPDC060223]|uniref:SWIM zinc finger family protein n=1 Tax=unclassified Streptomyces TaxID=2593676 RepID=UPI003639C849
MAGGRSADPPRAAASRARRNPRSQNRRTAPQDVRELLAGAFHLPSDTAPHDTTAADPVGAGTVGHRSALADDRPEVTSGSGRARLGGDGEVVPESGARAVQAGNAAGADPADAGTAGHRSALADDRPEVTSSAGRVRLGGDGEVVPESGARAVQAGDATAADPSDPADAGTAGHRSALADDRPEVTSGSGRARLGGDGEVVADSPVVQAGDMFGASQGAHPERAAAAAARESIRDSSVPRPGDRPVTTSDTARAQPDGAPVAGQGAQSGAADDVTPHAPRADPATVASPDATPTAPRSADPRPVERSAATRLPRSMGSPGRDGALRRTFEAFPARASGDHGFAETWWGNAWVRALEEGALDAARLARGRAYAGRGHVDAVTVTPGLVLAYVHGSRPRPYRVQVTVGTLSDADWDRFLDAVAERPGDIAALLDKEMPKSLAECGVALLPGPGELEPHCSCPDFGHPCKHAAALCYQTARLLDEDPFVLLLLRGRGERELLDALSRRNAARIARAAQDQEPAPLPGTRARDALARRVLSPLPAPLPPPAHPEQPPTYPDAPGGPDPFALDQLATDAAARAHTLLTAGRDPVAGLTLWQDAVRLAAARPGSGLTAATRALYASLAAAAGRTRADLARAVAAWRQGGFEGLAVLEEPWDPPAGRFDRARPLLLAADLPAFRPWRNHLTHPRGHAQLRLGHSGLWYAYESEPGQDDWWPRGTPDLDPVGALTGLGAPGDL